MFIKLGQNTIEIQDTGAPRGERNYWEVKLNGVVLYGDYNGKKAKELCEKLQVALGVKP
jgi:hypothetical protein